MSSRIRVAAAMVFVACGPAQAASLLRVACEGPDARAEVTVNGVFKGECPLDIQVDPGAIQLRVVKRIDADRERVHADDFRIGDGVVKKIDVALSAPRLNVDAQRRENERLARERAEARQREQARELARAAQEQLDRERVEAERRLVEAGDADAMLALADRYATGSGVAKNDAQAKSWLGRAFALGHPVAAFRSSVIRKVHGASDVADLERMLAFPVEPPRAIGAKDAEAARAVVDSDPFFAVPGKGDTVRYAVEQKMPNGHPAMRREHSCARIGERLFRGASRNNYSSAGESTSAFGGLLPLENVSRSTRLFASDTVAQKLLRIESVAGTPFPLTVERQFRIAYRLETKAAGQTLDVPVFLTCGALGGVTEIPNLKTEVGVPLVCLQQHGISTIFMFRTYWHEPSGCFVTADGR